ncbi:hypothetical protein AB0368_06715 [Actinoplanes sp. NPDC051475]|uniref:hypothetical protein n=1 Tax=Actinoplanes sp. NPDC051475 TaxID=3157225 RepID=UPI00344EE408
MPEHDSRPLPAALAIDHVVQELTEHAGYRIDGQPFNYVAATAPDALLAWLSAAGQYASADYQLQMLQRQIAGMRAEMAPNSGLNNDDIELFVEALGGLLALHATVSAALDEAHHAFIAACQPLSDEGLLTPDGRQWRGIDLITPARLDPVAVQVPQDAAAPWPLVRAGHIVVDVLARLHQDTAPEPGTPVLRRTPGGFATLNHQGVWRRLLPDPDGRYLLRGFAWHTPPAEPEPALAPQPPVEETGSAWISRFLSPGDRFDRATLPAGRHGIELSDGRVVVDTAAGFAALGHALLAQFDPPTFDEVETAGLCGNGTDGTGPHRWPDVARAALTRPVTVYIADVSTRHFDWYGTGLSEDEARDSLMRAWQQHAAHHGADPQFLRRDELNVRHGVIGTAWRDQHAFPPSP